MVEGIFLQVMENGTTVKTAMGRILEIALNIFLVLFGLGLAGWVFIRVLKRSEDPARIVFKIIWSAGVVIGLFYYIRSMTKHLGGGMTADLGTALMIAGLVVTGGIILSITWTPQISEFLFSPLTSLFDGGTEPPEPKPFYSIALAKRKLNRPLEAIADVREQLAKFPNDFEGISLLASIQAEDTKDLPGAEITFNHFCDWPEAPPRQVAAAWTQMADWHLKIAQDVDSARASLEKIIAKFPGSAVSSGGGATPRASGRHGEILLAAHDRQALVVPEGVKNIGLLDSSHFYDRKKPLRKYWRRNMWKHLEQHPRTRRCGETGDHLCAPLSAAGSGDAGTDANYQRAGPAAKARGALVESAGGFADSWRGGLRHGARNPGENHRAVSRPAGGGSGAVPVEPGEA